MTNHNITQISVCKPKIQEQPLFTTGTRPWELGHPQDVVLDLLKNKFIHGDVLDIGCGIGDNSIAIAKEGHLVWGIDLSKDAIDCARTKIDSDKKNPVFILGNALDLHVLGETFNTIIDIGLFQVLNENERALYLEALLSVSTKGSSFFILSLSEKLKDDSGPVGLRKSEIRKYFNKQYWKVDSIQSSFYQTISEPKGQHAWLVSITRK